MSEEQGKITTIDVVRPLMTPDQAKVQWAVFEDLKKQLLVDDDYQKISGKLFIKRSGFRKIAVFFGISDSILKEEKVDRADGSFVWRIVVEAIAPNGRTSVGVGACDSKERANWAHKEHDCYSTAHTRAKSRAISDMIAGGIVSAEEVEASSQEPREIQSSERTSNPSVIITDYELLPWRPYEQGEGEWILLKSTPEAEALVAELKASGGLKEIEIRGVKYRVMFGKGDEGLETFVRRFAIRPMTPSAAKGTLT